MNPLIVFVLTLTFGTNTSLGTMTSIVGILIVLCVYLFARLYKTEKHSKFLPVFGILGAASICVLFFGFTKLTAVIMYIGYSINYIFPSTVNYINRNYLTQKYKLEEYIVENNAFAEVFLDLGRVVCFVLMLLVGLSGSIKNLYFLFGFISASLVVFSFFVWHLENKNRLVKDEE